MNISEIGNKKYYELNKDEIKLFDESVDKFDLSLNQRNNIFIRLLFDMTIKESVKQLGGV